MESVSLKEFEENLQVIESVGDLICFIEELTERKTKIELIEYSIMRLNNLKQEIENEKV